MSLEDKVEINSFDLARKMHELYREYKCDHELPEYEDLAAKIELAEPWMRRFLDQTLDSYLVHPISLHEAKELVSDSFMQKILQLYGIVFLQGTEYMTDKEGRKKEGDDKKRSGFTGLYRTIISGVKNVPAAFKAVFLRSNEERAKEVMNYHNIDARKRFEQFKAEVNYEFAQMEHKWN